jgi:hypothetical protein
MKKPQIIFDLLSFEVRFSNGHLYWDRCGQTLLDIEKLGTGWYSAFDGKHSGRIENIEKDILVTFGFNIFNVQIKKPDESNIDSLIDEIKNCWKIVKANFGLDTFDRIGCRLHFMIPTKSFEETEEIIKSLNLNLSVPDKMIDLGYKLKIRHIIGVFEKDQIEHRIEIKSVVRNEGINPADLFKGDPRAMSKRQREYRNLKLKQISQYNANPMYGLMLDIDNVQYDPDNINVSGFINTQIEIVNNDFLITMV